MSRIGLSHSGNGAGRETCKGGEAAQAASSRHTIDESISFMFSTSFSVYVVALEGAIEQRQCGCVPTPGIGHELMS
jgi:hypothetical protein